MKRRLRETLSDVVPQEELVHVYNSYDVVGDIAVIRLTEKSWKHGKAIAEAVFKVHRNVKTVLAQAGSVSGDFRLRRLEYVAGENKFTTVHKEHGCLFSVDVEKCYFSPRLLHERMRVAKQTKKGEIVINLFAGVGCFSIIMASHSEVGRVYSIDVNPAAVKYMQENIRLNRVYGKVVPLQGDAREIIQKRLRHVADRIIMPLPEKALEYFPYALLALKKKGGVVHFYSFEYANKNESAVEKGKLKITERLDISRVKFELLFGRVVRTVGPNWYQIVIDIATKE